MMMHVVVPCLLILPSTDPEIWQTYQHLIWVNICGGNRVMMDIYACPPHEKVMKQLLVCVLDGSVIDSDMVVGLK